MAEKILTWKPALQATWWGHDEDMPVGIRIGYRPVAMKYWVSLPYAKKRIDRTIGTAENFEDAKKLAEQFYTNTKEERK